MREILVTFIAAVMLVPILAAPALSQADDGPRWLAGDWHVHTTASHDACHPANATGFVTEMDPEDGCGDGPHTLSTPGAVRMREAEARGLDYMRITDHNTLAGMRDAAEGYDGPVTLVPGYEHSLPGGHAGISTLDLLDRGRFDEPDGDTDAAVVNAVADDVAEAPGGLFVVNHPTDKTVDDELTVYQQPGFDWTGADAFEVWNIHWLYRDEVFQGHLPSSENDLALDLWTQKLDEGYEIPIVGGSDNHWTILTPIQGPGQPTTWVYADANTPAAILDAVEEGRTYVAWDPAHPRLTFQATETGTGDTKLMGDRLSGQATYTVQVETTAPGDRLRLVSCDGVKLDERLTGSPTTVDVDLELQEPCWMRAEVVTVDDEAGPEHLLYKAITSPIYVR